jgi:polygalacturonase
MQNPLKTVMESAMRLLPLLFCLYFLLAPSAICADGVFSIRDYGAMGDGATLDTNAIQKTIDACAQDGGGLVLFPPGTYLSGTLHLKSRVHLRLEAGATLIGTTDLQHYQFFQAPEGTPEARSPRWHSALILGVSVEDVTISGSGVIDGNKVFDPRGEEKMRGPHTLLFGNSRNIVIRDISVVDSANYALLFEFTSQIEVRNITCTGGWDGVHFRGWIDAPCRDLRITDCQFYTGDDSIAGRYAEQVLIRNCVINTSCNGIRIIGPVKHMIVDDCLFYGPGVEPHRTQDRHNMLSGIILQPGAWGASDGAMEDILISSVTMKNVATPVTLYLRRSGNTAKDITVAGLTATGVYRGAASVESWSETAVENVVFRDIDIEYAGGESHEAGERPAQAPSVDSRSLPAWGFYMRNVNDIRLHDMRLTYKNEDFRPVIHAENVTNLDMNTILFDQPKGIDNPIRLHKVTMRE